MINIHHFFLPIVHVLQVSFCLFEKFDGNMIFSAAILDMRLNLIEKISYILMCIWFMNNLVR